MEPTKEQLENAIKDIAVMFERVRKDDLSFIDADIVMVLTELGYLDNHKEDEEMLEYCVYSE